MKHYKLLTMACVGVVTMALQAQEYTMTKSAPFNPLLTHGYELCEANVTKMIEEEAVSKYMGCKVDIKRYQISVEHVSQGDRSLSLDECTIEETVTVTSEYLDNNDYLKGSSGAVCSNLDTRLIEKERSWSEYEVGVFYGMSNSQDELEMSSDDNKIYYDYAHVPMIGIQASYVHKILSSQYIGAKLFFSKAFENYEETSFSTSKSRNDGDPSILRLGAGLHYGYRYHLRTEFSVGMNYYQDTVTRTYANNTYTATVNGFNANVGVGYYVLSWMKIWANVGSDLSGNVGVSWVY